ncbi:MAG: bifunctional phosphopantothenoylcysteine decarboxylase/phosphopantothenate--cysteine ligase CoaBC, partial [Pseudomonadota bacterium]
YKCLDLVRRLKERGHSVRTIMTQSAQAFITPLAVSALTNERVFTELFDVDDEREIGHIKLSRQSDIIVVAPATANLIARMANGLADDLATATLLANDKPLLVAPAMNPKMWSHPATQRNVAQLQADGAQIVGPDAGEMAESGEAGVGRLVETMTLVAAIEERLAVTASEGALLGKHLVITAGPTHEPIDPVRYIANRSSGKQGFAIARAAAEAGARVTLVSGPVGLPDPVGVDVQ